MKYLKWYDRALERSEVNISHKKARLEITNSLNDVTLLNTTGGDKCDKSTKSSRGPECLAGP